MRAFYVTDGCHFPPRGVRGGGDGAPSLPYKVTTEGQEDPLPPIASTDLEAGELLLHLLSGGGGYGDPLLREPERVREDVLSQFISFERARDVYGVVFENTELSDALVVDMGGTVRLREVIRAGH
jgi:N-methylhydantoinase B